MRFGVLAELSTLPVAWLSAERCVNERCSQLTGFAGRPFPFG